MLQLRQADDRVTVHRDWFKDYKFHLIRSVAELKKLVDICVQRKLCSLDVETTGVDSRVYPDDYFEDGRTTRHGIRTVDKIVGCCISFDGVNGYYVPLAHEPDDSENLPWDPAWDELTRIVENCKVIFHNSKFDSEMLYPVTGKDYWKLEEYEDTFLVAKVISPLKSHPAGLKPLTQVNYGIEMVELDELFTYERKEQLKREGRRYNYAMMHPREGLEYGCSDGIFTYKLWWTLKEKLSDGDQKIYNLEKSFCNVIREMERNRVHLDVERVNQLYVECKAALESTGKYVRDIIESKTGSTGRWLRLNVGSPTQLSEAMFTDPEGLKLKPLPSMEGEGDYGGDSDDDDDGGPDEGDVQYSLKDEVVKLLHKAYGEKLSVFREGHKDKDGKPKKESLFELVLEYRHYDKMKGSYVEKFFKSHDKYGDVRPAFNQMGTDTARLSSKAEKIENGYSGVNFQGIPRDSDEDKPELFKQIRTCIAPREGWMLVKLDYSGEELRVVTNLSGDPIWTKTFLHGDGDVHSITARTLFGKTNVNKDERNRGKRCNFAFIYGGGSGAIQRNVDCSMEDAQRHMDNLRNDVPVLMGYVDSQKHFAKKHKCIYTAFGRRIPIPTIDSPIQGIRRKAERCAINYTIQSTSADVLKFAMCYVDKQLRALGWKQYCRYVLTVHDEIVFEIRPEWLMTIVPKLDEWMTTPWRIPKAHGREWVVPLETEPGIDVHWRARFDFFKMTRGEPADPKKIREDGSYSGDLKKGTLYENGRIYQEVPDFLQAYVKRNGPPALPAAEQPVAPVLPPQEPEPESVPVQAPVEEPAPPPVSEAPPEAAPPEAAPPEEAQKAEEETTQHLEAPDPEPDPEPAAPAPKEVVKEEQPAKVSMDFDLGDMDLDFSPASPPSVAPKQDLGPVTPTPDPEPPKTISSSEKVFRWMLGTNPSMSAARRLEAITILCEGPTLLRVVNSKGEILIPESHGIRVHQEKFLWMTEVFGLG